MVKVLTHSRGETYVTTNVRRKNKDEENWNQAQVQSRPSRWKHSEQVS